jgi:hypothetical protein
MEIDQAAAKARYGPPDDDDSKDAELDVWAGEIPIITALGDPVASPGLRPQIPIGASKRNLQQRAATENSRSARRFGAGAWG